MTGFGRAGKAVIATLLILATAGCAAAPAGPIVGAAAFRPAAVGLANAKTDALDYLNVSLGDFTVVDKILADQELSLQDPNDSGGQELTADTADHYITLIGGYDAQLKSALSAIETRYAPADADLAEFKAADKAELELMSEVLEEYQQLVRYAQALFLVEKDVQDLQNIPTSGDLQASYDSFSASIKKAMDSLAKADVPSFLKNFNDNLTGALKEMDDAVFYSLSAVALKDPVRTNAAAYRMGILQRKFEKLLTGVAAGLQSRQGNLADDAKKIRASNDGLRQWAQANIARLK